MQGGHVYEQLTSRVGVDAKRLSRGSRCVYPSFWFVYFRIMRLFKTTERSVSLHMNMVVQHLKQSPCNAATWSPAFSCKHRLCLPLHRLLVIPEQLKLWEECWPEVLWCGARVSRGAGKKPHGTAASV